MVHSYATGRAMTPGDTIIVRSRGNPPPDLKKRIDRLGTRAKVLNIVESSKHFPGAGPCLRLQGVGDDPDGWEGDEGGYKSWVPVSMLDGDDLEDVRALAKADVYSELSKADAAHLKERAQRIRTHQTTAATAIVSIGLELLEAKGSLAHGQFEAWCAQELSWSQSTTWRYMSVAKAFPDILHGERFEARALYVLARPQTPEQARTHALELAARGETVDEEKAKELVGMFGVSRAPDINRPLKAAARATTKAAEDLTAWGAPAEVVRKVEDAAQAVKALAEAELEA